MSKNLNRFQDVIKDNPSLALFIKKMGEFDRTFCDLMSSGVDFNIRLEVRGNRRELIHCRLMTDDTERPSDLQNQKSCEPSA